MDLFAGFVDGVQRRAGEFELAAGFQCNMAASVFQRHRAALFLHRLPAEACQRGEKGLNAAVAVEWQGSQRSPIEYEFFVFRTQSPATRGFAGILEILDKLTAV